VCDKVLGAAVVLGTEFQAATVAAVLAEAEDQVLDAADEAAATGLVLPAADRPGRWAFVHALVLTARYDALGTTERTKLHRRALEALEGAYESRAAAVRAGIEAVLELDRRRLTDDAVLDRYRRNPPPQNPNVGRPSLHCATRSLRNLGEWSPPR
jgi:hypothetical protein